MYINVVPFEAIKDNKSIIKKIKKIINENLVSNGGTLKRDDLLDGKYEFSFVTLALDEHGKLVGFSLIRTSDYDQHNTGYDSYYYISDIVVSKSFITNLMLKKCNRRGL